MTKLHECCDRAACIGNALMSRPMFNILVRYVAVAELCSLPLSVLRCEEDEDIVGTCSDTNNIRETQCKTSASKCITLKRLLVFLLPLRYLLYTLEPCIQTFVFT